ncbi:MAG: biopolymer transporter ExbD, partial [Gemmataceae bacterium]
RSLRRGMASGEGGINLAVIITPFLDMAFQLLAFFIMTYNPSALEGHVKGSLETPPGACIGQGKDLGGDLPAFEETAVVTIQAVKRGQTEGGKHDGEPQRILLKRVEDLQPTAVVDAETGLEDGLRKLHQKLKQGGSPENIRIVGDGDLHHQFVLRVYDVCKEAGCRNVAFVAPAANR